MPFVEIVPLRPAKSDGTGVRVSLNDRGGLVVSISGEALEALGGGRAERAKVMLDLDPALPRMRIVTDDSGNFRVSKPPLGDRVRLVRVGHRPEFGSARFKSLDCIWSPLDDERYGLDIDLPREMRLVATAVKSATTSLGDVRMSPVSLPGTRAKVRT